METDDLQALAENIARSEKEKARKHENITKQAIDFFYKGQVQKFIDLYNKNFTSVHDRVEALSIFWGNISEKEHCETKCRLKFREKILKTNDNDFVYLMDCGLFLSGTVSPNEFIQSIEEGTEKQVPLAYVIKSFFFKYGLEDYEQSKQAIEKAILLEPQNLEYKQLLKELENSIREITDK